MLLELATGTCRGKVGALVDVRRAYFYAPARRRVFVELPPEDYQPGNEHMCGLLRYNLYGTRDVAQNWEEELGSYTQQSKTDERKRVLVRVERSHRENGDCCSRAWG